MQVGLRVLVTRDSDHCPGLMGGDGGSTSQVLEIEEDKDKEEEEGGGGNIYF
jgi:hypothetical protein